MDLDEMQNSRLDSIDDRLRSVEAAVVELAQTSRWIKYGVVVLMATFGMDVSSMAGV